ncbi:MAG: DUF3486 family protein [Desulfuromonadaceae bacterium]|nr:DUF3486 family protein [Desulfuromonadaceae bacterium]
MRRSTIQSLPLNIIIEVKRRLRANQATQQDITDWINGLGHSVTKSSLNRYAMKLYKADTALGMDRDIMAVKDADVVALFEELATLKAREAAILTQIRMSIAP